MSDTKPSSDLSTALSSPILPMILGAVAIASWAGVFIMTSNANDNGYYGNSWPSIRGQVIKVIGSIMMGMFILLVTSIIYFLQDQTKSIYVIFFLVAFASALSYSALAAASIS
jgi:hypothetical protein